MNSTVNGASVIPYHLTPGQLALVLDNIVHTCPAEAVALESHIAALETALRERDYRREYAQRQLRESRDDGRVFV